MMLQLDIPIVVDCFPSNCTCFCTFVTLILTEAFGKYEPYAAVTQFDLYPIQRNEQAGLKCDIRSIYICQADRNTSFVVYCST